MAFTKALVLNLALTLLLLPGHVQAANSNKDTSSKNATAITKLLVHDSFSLQLVSGFLYSPVIENGHRPELDYLQSNLRFIWMLDPEATTDKIGLGGNFDLIFEVTTSIILKGAGNVISGVTGLLRYDFAPSQEHFRYYVQAGVGIVYSDAYEDLSQSLIGNPIEFTPQLSVGVHYLLSRRWSIDGEVMFQHISNAGINKDRNVGVNALGGFTGVSYSF
jgi:hypothetical protein